MRKSKAEQRADALEAALTEITEQRDRWQDEANLLRGDNETLSQMVRSMAAQLDAQPRRLRRHRPKR